MDILKLFAEVSGLSVFILAAVAQIKRFNVKGYALEASAYGVGLVIGGLYRYFVYSPVLPVEWFWLVLFGMAGGFIATGVYQSAESATGGGAIKREIAANAECVEEDYDPCAEDGK